MLIATRTVETAATFQQIKEGWYGESVSTERRRAPVVMSIFKCSVQIQMTLDVNVVQLIKTWMPASEDLSCVMCSQRLQTPITNYICHVYGERTCTDCLKRQEHENTCTICRPSANIKIE